MAQRDADSFYVQDCRQVQTNTHTIQTLTGQISRMVGTLEAEKDFQHCRSLVDEAIRQATGTKTILARIREHQHQAQNAAERNNRRMMYQKLSDNLGITARVLEDVIRRFTVEERRFCGNLEASSSSSGIGVAGGDVAGGNEQQLLLEGAGVLDDEPKASRSSGLHKTTEDMRCLQQIYTDLASSVEEQQQTSFTTLESHMVRESSDLEKGREEIQIPGKYGLVNLVHRRIQVAAGIFLGLAVVSWGIWS